MLHATVAEPHEIEGDASDRRCRVAVGLDERPWRALLQVGIGQRPDGARFCSSPPELQRFVMAAQQPHTPRDFGRQPELRWPALAAIGNGRTEYLVREAQSSVHEISEDIGKVLVHVGGKTPDSEVRVGCLRRIGDQPPAPEVGR